jgi:hypothetical protein
VWVQLAECCTAEDPTTQQELAFGRQESLYTSAELRQLVQDLQEQMQHQLAAL